MGKAMSDLVRLTDDLALTPKPPGPDELSSLSDQGFKSVVDLRTAEEPDQVLSPSQEGEEARRIGLSHLHFPLRPDELDGAHASKFKKQLEKLPKPVVIHCASGRRAGLFGLASLDDGGELDRGLQICADAGLDIPPDKARSLQNSTEKTSPK